jgi:uncharacterized small protein (DUF1192 family)
MQDEDEFLPRRRRLDPLPLAALGVNELRAYIEELRAEILRVEADIAGKAGHRKAAEGFFRTG